MILVLSDVSSIRGLWRRPGTASIVAAHHVPPPDGGGGARRRGGEKPQSKYLQISDLKFSEIACVAFPLRPLRGHLPRKTGEDYFRVVSRGKRLALRSHPVAAGAAAAHGSGQLDEFAEDL